MTDLTLTYSNVVYKLPWHLGDTTSIRAIFCIARRAAKATTIINHTFAAAQSERANCIAVHTT